MAENLNKTTEQIDHENDKSEMENCYVLAQNLNNPEILSILIKHGMNGVNAVDNAGDSLLMRDIRDFKCTNFEMLIENGADVNYCNDQGLTALHCAVINKYTPIDVIKKLIELGADVNKKLHYIEVDEDDWETEINDDGGGDTPLISLIKNYAIGQDSFEKVKLLIKANTDLNLKNKIGKTALNYACGTDSGGDIQLIKILLEHGAKVSSDDDNITPVSTLLDAFLEACVIYQADYINELTTNYFIPAIDLLNKAGDDFFLLDNGSYSCLSWLLSVKEDEPSKRAAQNKLIVQFVRTGFERLLSIRNGYINGETHEHPLQSVINGFRRICEDEKLFKEITDLILCHPTNEFKTLNIWNDSWKLQFREDNTFAKFACIMDLLYKDSGDISVVGAFIRHVPFKEMKNWLIKLKEHYFDFNIDQNIFNILLLRYMQSEMSSTREDFLDIIDYLLQISVLVHRHNFEFKDENLQALKTGFDLPDSIWISAAFGNIDCLKKFLPYWNQHPLLVLYFLRPWTESTAEKQTMMLRSIETILPFLIELGGPLSHDSNLYNVMQIYLNKCFSFGGHIIHIDDFSPDPATKEAAYTRIYRSLKTLHEEPTSLQVLCRTIIRERASAGHRNDLPNYLSSIVPSGLKKFLSFLEVKEE